MQITTAQDLQNHFKSGLIIVGENEDRELEWLGNDKDWGMLKVWDKETHKGWGEPDITIEAYDYSQD